MQPQKQESNQINFNFYLDGNNTSQVISSFKEILQQISSTFSQQPQIHLQVNTTVPDAQFLLPGLLQQQYLYPQASSSTQGSAYNSLLNYRMTAPQATTTAASLKRPREQEPTDLTNKRQKVERRSSFSAAYNFQPHELTNLPVQVLNDYASAFGIPQGQDPLDLTQRLVRRLSEVKTNEQLSERVQVSVLFDGHNHGFLIRRNASNLRKLYEMVAAVLRKTDNQFDLYLNTTKLNRDIANPIEFYHISDGALLQVLPNSAWNTENAQQPSVS